MGKQGPKQPWKWPALPGETEVDRVKRRTQSYRLIPGYYKKQNDKYVKSERGHKVNLVLQARSRHAKKFGVRPDLKVDDIEWPKICPVLGTELIYGWGRGWRTLPAENIPSIDQIDPGKGYTKDNVAIISWKANSIKNTGTAEEHRMIAVWIDKNIRR